MSLKKSEKCQKFSKIKNVLFLTEAIATTITKITYAAVVAAAAATRRVTEEAVTTKHLLR